MVTSKKPRNAAVKAKAKNTATKQTGARRTARKSAVNIQPAKPSASRNRNATFDRFFEWLEQQTQKIKAEDLEGLMGRAMEIRLATRGPAALGYYLGTGKRILGYARDYWNGNHRELPWYSITAAAAATLYMLSPIDLIPDFIPVLGTLDDAAVIATCLALIERDLQRREALGGKSAGDVPDAA